MTPTAPRLGQVEPRERAGAQTARKYEYQYERTARAALELLTDSTKHICVYCDWHDDYVVETGDPPTGYLFHQVKGRRSSQGPWKFSEFFGVRRRTNPSRQTANADPNAVVPRMLLHYANFGDSCAGIAFVTNAGLNPELSAFLHSLACSADAGALTYKERIVFNHIARAYAAAIPPLVALPEQLFAWMQGFAVYTDQGQIESADAALLEIADVVFNYSEIDLSMRQAKQIARDIISEVRRKVSFCNTVVPASNELLKREKGVVVTDLLGVLSLSTQAYEALKAGAAFDTVKTLSRLQRFCKKYDLENLIVHISEFKARWDVWRTIERHNVNGADFLLLEMRAQEVLQGNLTHQRIVAEAKDIAKQFGSIGATELQAEDVMGLIFSRAAQAEAW